MLFGEFKSYAESVYLWHEVNKRVACLPTYSSLTQRLTSSVFIPNGRRGMSITVKLNLGLSKFRISEMDTVVIFSLLRAWAYNTY